MPLQKEVKEGNRVRLRLDGLLFGRIHDWIFVHTKRVCVLSVWFEDVEELKQNNFYKEKKGISSFYS